MRMQNCAWGTGHEKASTSGVCREVLVSGALRAPLALEVNKSLAVFISIRALDDL